MVYTETKTHTRTCTRTHARTTPDAERTDVLSDCMQLGPTGRRVMDGKSDGGRDGGGGRVLLHCVTTGWSRTMRRVIHQTGMREGTTVTRIPDLLLCCLGNV